MYKCYPLEHSIMQQRHISYLERSRDWPCDVAATSLTEGAKSSGIERYRKIRKSELKSIESSSVPRKGIFF